MLVLTRKPGEKVVIDGGIIPTVVEVHGNKVRIGIEALSHVPVLRGELVTRLNETKGLEQCIGAAKACQPASQVAHLPSMKGPCVRPPNPFRKLRRIPR